MPIEVLHSGVPGRLRLRLSGLYRSPVAEARLRRSLADLDGIALDKVNRVLGTVLIRYPLGRSSDAVLALVSTALSEPTVAAPARAGPTGTAAHRSARSVSGRPQDDDGPAWHALSDEEVLVRLEVDPRTGLSAVQVDRRRARFGRNELLRAAERSRLEILSKQFATLPVAMLGVSAGIAVVTGGLVDAAVILGVVAINAAIGYVTEQQAERTIRALSEPGVIEAEVIRDSEARWLPTEQLVPGDLLVLAPGQPIGADARLLRARRLTVDESVLTGESVPALKEASVVLEPDAPLGDRRNSVYMGTVVSGGNGLAVVTDTADRTELGRIQSLVDTARPPETPMERQLGRLGTQLGILSGAVCVGVFAVGLLRGQPLLQMLNSAVSLAVAAVPEGLPAVATTTLALGIRNMRRRRVAVRKLDAVESLGSLQVLCLDKTGTLTANHMTVVELFQNGELLQVSGRHLFRGDQAVPPDDLDDSRWLMLLASLCSEARFNGQDPQCPLEGSPTEVALLELALAHDLDVHELRRRHPLVEARQRAEGRPLMSTLHEFDGRWLVAVKGSPAEVLARCNRIRRRGRVGPLSKATGEELLGANEGMAGRALRVLAVAYRHTDRRQDMEAEGLTWVGLVGMQDPLRPGMVELMRTYHQAGIRTVMITGDQSATAYAIGQQLGLGRDGHLEILDSSRLDRLDPQLLAGLVTKVDVFARVSPAHKLRIVQALQQAGRVVAMTGDGINDGPALKAADVGVAMGAGGSDVARSVSDVVIEDDNLHTMAEAVHQGRAIYTNIRRTVHYLLSTNLSEIEVMFGALALGLGQPLTPMQLLWINLVTDIFPGLALSLEPAGKGLMRLPPRPKEEPIVTGRRLARMSLESGAITLGALSAFAYGRATGGPGHGSSLAFHSLTTAQLLHSIYCRSEYTGLFNPGGRPRNRWLDIALGGTAAVHLLFALLPQTRRLLGTTPLRPADLLVIAGAAGLPLLINEGSKLRNRTRAVDSSPSAPQESPT